MKVSLWAFRFWIVVSFLPAAANGYELRPGLIRDPAGNQTVQTAVYNPILDNYLLLYEDGRALAGHLSPNGVFSGETVISPNIGVTHVVGAFNPEDRTFLVVYRDGEPPEIFGRYLTSNGMPIGNAFSIGPGGAPKIAFSPESGRYVVTWEQLSSGYVRYRVIDGDSTSASPRITPMSTIGRGLSDTVAYSSGADKFLVAFIREVPGSKVNVYGRFVSSNGLSVGPEFVIAGGSDTQTSPRAAYAASTNRWMVIWENWSNCGGGCPHIRGALVAANGSTVKSFPVASTAGWDLPGPIGYNSATDTFLTGWRSAISDTNIEARAGEFSPEDGRLVRPTVLLSDRNVGVEGLALRPDASDPQAMFLWRFGFGGDGLHAGIINLRALPPTPDNDPPAAITDLKGAASTEGPALEATAIASTNAGPGGQDMTKTVDARPGTFWSSPDWSSVVSEFITWDLGSEKALSQVSLLARSAGNLFPLDYQIQVSTNNVTFATVFSVTGASVARGAWAHHPLPEPAARYVKLLITKAPRTGRGKYKAQLAEVEFVEATDGARVTLEWTAPGDDGKEGTASAYDLRWSRNPITAGNFAGATALSAPAPSPAGTKESVTLSGFPREDQVYFAMKARDETNVSELSNVISVATPGSPPAAVLGFAASNVTGTSVSLSWQPSGDDGNAGNASSYDIRYSTAPITDANFAAATSVVRPASHPKPAVERYTLSGLASETTFYFAIKALDELGNASLINGGGPVTATTTDSLPPAAITDLAVHGRTATNLNAAAIAASSQSSPREARTKATDGNPTSFWSTLGSRTPREEFITLDLGTARSIGRVDLLSRPAGALFPRDLEIQVSRDNVSFTTVAEGVELPATRGMRHIFEFTTTTARYVRVFITETRISGGGLYYAQIAEIQVVEAITSYLLTLTWTEPGDDGSAGTAASYDLRYSRSPIGNENQFENALALEGEPAPTQGGRKASFSFEPPEEGVTLHFRMRALDSSGNASPLSNQASALVAIVPPRAVSDLSAFNAQSTSVDLAWTSTGDDEASGTAASFDIRYATTPIDSSNFAGATEVLNEPVPAVSGTRQQMTVSGLSPNTTYHFAMAVLDESETPSTLSNVASLATSAPDETAPSEVTDLRGSLPFNVIRVTAPAMAASSVESATAGFAKATDGIATSYWGSFGRNRLTTEWITLDAGAVRSIGEVRLWSRPAGGMFPEELEIQLSADNLTFETVHRATGLSAERGMLHTLNFPAASGRYVRVLVTKPRRSLGGLYAAQIAEMQVFEAIFVPGPLILSWTAPGDDGPNGTAASYDVRYSAAPIESLADFTNATTLAGEPVPHAAGAIESMEVNLPAGAYYFALRVRDEAGNQSGISNVPRIVVP